MEFETGISEPYQLIDLLIGAVGGVLVAQLARATKMLGDWLATIIEKQITKTREKP